MSHKVSSLKSPTLFVFAVTYIERLMVVIFGSDEWGLNDVQVSSCHCHWGMSTVRERKRED